MAEPPNGLQVTLRENGLDVDWRIDSPVLQLRSDQSIAFGLEGCLPSDQPGQPVLIVCRKLFALPAGAQPEVKVTGSMEQEMWLPEDGWIPLYQPAGLMSDGTETVLPAAALQGDFTPVPVQIEFLGKMAGVNLARLSFFPLRVQAGKLVVTRQVLIQVNFHAPDGPLHAGMQLADTNMGPLVDTLQANVLNPRQIQVNIMPAGPNLSAQAGPEAAQRAAVEVTQPGITRLTYSELKSAGFPVDAVNPHMLHLTRTGSEIAFEWDGNDDSAFESSERILFYADPRFSRYTGSDVYFLSVSSDPGQRILSVNASPDGLTAGSAHVQQIFERNLVYTPDCNCAPIPPGRDGDRWTWQDLRYPTNAARSHVFSLTDLDSSQAAKLTFWMIGYTDVPAVPDHLIRAAINGVKLGDLSFDGKHSASIALDIAPGILKVGDNTLTLTLPGIAGVAVEGAWLDAFAIDYVRTSTPVGSQVLFAGDLPAGKAYTVGLTSMNGLVIYDVTTPSQPYRLSGWRTIGSGIQWGDLPGSENAHSYAASAEMGLLVPARVRLATALPVISGADELMIAPAGFIPALDGLVALRQSQGLSVAVMDLQGIYDAVDGRPEPDAIHQYLTDVFATWSPRPSYVLLVGDGTVDPKRYRTNSSLTYIPPYLVDVDPVSGETAADNRYAAVDGPDALPDFLLGRLPVNSNAELLAVVQKIIQYEQPTSPGSWRHTLAFIADDDGGDANNFQSTAEGWILENIQSPQWPARYYYDSLAGNDAGFHQAVVNRWQAGAKVMVYHGHSSIHQWGVSQFFHLQDVAGLTNGRRLPILLEMTCLTGSFQVPNLPTLDESLLRQPGGGAVAAWGSTGFGFSTAHDRLANGFLNSLQPDTDVSIGAAIIAGKLDLATHLSVGLDSIDTFTLLGDPATVIRMDTSVDVSVFLPLMIK